MNVLSRNKVLAAGIALILLTNVYVIGGALWNRAGDPDAIIELTERELPLPSWNPKENSGLSLRLDWNSYISDYGFYAGALYDRNIWLDTAKLQEVGFDDIPAGDRTALMRYIGKKLPRPAWIVLEFNGPAYQAALKETEEKAREEERLLGNDTNSEMQKSRLEDVRRRLLWMQHTASRLLPVDAGLDPRQLRQRYPDTSHYILVSGRIRISYDDRGNGRITGFIDSISITSIHVPSELHAIFNSLPPIHDLNEALGYPQAYEPRYRVKVAYGRRYEPWIMSVEAIRN